jgi:subtilisin family serine protease
MWRTARTASGLAAAAMLAASLSEPAVASKYPPGFDPLPMKLPPAGAHASTAQQRTWILGIRHSAQAHRIAARFGAERIIDAAVSLPSTRARQAAAALRRAGELRYAEPDVRQNRSSAIDGHPEQWARVVIVPPSMPAPAPGGVRVGIIDDEVDITHADLGGHTTQIRGGPIIDPHGTMVASVVSAAAGNGGVMGVFPSVPILSWSTNFTCGDVARAVSQLDEFGAKVINISLGSPYPCVTQNIAIQQAIGDDVIVVAAAGNEFEQGNLPQ